MLDLLMNADTLFFSFSPSYSLSSVFIIDSLSFVASVFVFQVLGGALANTDDSSFNSVHHTNDSFFNGILITKPNCNFLFMFKYRENKCSQDSYSFVI